MTLLKPAEAAQELGISPKTLYKWVSQRRIGHVKIGSKLRFLPSHLEEFISTNTIAPRKELA